MLGSNDLQVPRGWYSTLIWKRSTVIDKYTAIVSFLYVFGDVYSHTFSLGYAVNKDDDKWFYVKTHVGNVDKSLSDEASFLEIHFEEHG